MRVIGRWWIVALWLFPGVASADLVGSAISVQGVLSADGLPAEGVYDLRLTPYPDAVGSTPSGPPQEVDNVLVVGGAFTTRVDFGLSLFQGDRVFVEIGVRAGNSTGSYEALLPRQELTPAPYALKPAPGSVGGLEIISGSVGPAQLLDGGVQTGELADGAVSALKLGDGAVTNAKLADGAVGAGKLANAAVGSGAIADGAVTSADLADGAVGAAQIGDGAVGTAELADGSVTSGKLGADSVDGGKVLDGSIGAADLAPGAIPPSGWTLNGNAPTAAQFLGTTNGTPLALRTDVGVTINGDRFNNSTELTVRGSPATAETNADLTLWPRGGTAFFNLAAIGADPATAQLAIASVGTSPFTGYVSRLILSHAGALGVGSANPTPQATLHAIRSSVGVDASDFSEAFEFIAEDGDAQAALLSSNSGGGGSTLVLGEMVSGNFANGWGLWRATGTTTNVPLHLSYGTSSTAPSNPSRLALFADGSLAAGAQMPSVTPTTSFVFADGSSAAAVNPTAANQFLVRAAGGVALNGPPLASLYELTVNGAAASGPADLVLRQQGSTAGMLVTADGADAASARFRVLRLDTSSGLSFQSRLWIGDDGFVGLNAGFADPAFPLVVGTNTTNGNGARLTAGGVWTNGSSRTFKEAFEAVDVEDVLQRLLALPVQRWRYKGGADPGLHMGPVAEDFRAAFGLGDDARYIGTVDADGVALAAVQGLAARLERENRTLRAALDALLARIEALETARGDGPPAR
jgi:hypothetical protein